MKRIYKTFLVIVLSTSCYSANAQDNETAQYHRAYNACSPLAQNQTMTQCNYARMVEGYYTTCMKQNGFSDSEESMSKDRYDSYLKSYRQCTSIANGAAQTQCNYGVVYQGYYNKCMLEKGFNSSGERASNSPQQGPVNEDTDRPVKSDTVKRKSGSISKFFDSIL